MAIEIVDFPINSMVIFPLATLNYQMVDFAMNFMEDLPTTTGDYW